ncbi:MAG: competence/damage-inducible protein A [Blastocatellia bacterium]|nr:competence/damage-inducible protein A [Blastocatellia bacterium]
MKEPTAAILVIGDEILSGKTEEGNARYLISELRNLGVALKLIMVVPDDVDHIAEVVADISKKYTYVFTSGGVGPTHDDVTLAGISRAFGRQIVRNPELEALIRNYLGEKVTESHLQMADVPEGAWFIHNSDLKWPLLACENVYILPGVPRFFREKFHAVKERFRTNQFHLRCIYTQEDEFSIAVQMKQIASDYPSVSIGSYPSFDNKDYKVKITIESKDQESVEAAFAAMCSLLKEDLIVRYQ